MSYVDAGDEECDDPDRPDDLSLFMRCFGVLRNQYFSCYNTAVFYNKEQNDYVHIINKKLYLQLIKIYL